MKRHTASLAVIASALIAVGCSSDGEPAATPSADTSGADADLASTNGAADGPTIRIDGFAFSALAPVAPGAQVLVDNVDGAMHTLTADDGSFNTGGLEAGGAITITAPTAPGAYAFVCNIHPSMTGTLTVEG